MTQVLDRPTTEVDVRTQTEVRPRPIELDREVRQLPPVGEPPGRFRWLGWLLGVAAVAAIAWLVIGEITADDTPVASPSYVVIEGITADPKVRTPVVTPEMVNESIRTGIPGDATLTQIVTFGHNSGRPVEDATVNPMIYWAVQPTYATMMEEATVSPLIYEAAAIEPNWRIENYELISTYPHVTKSAYPGVYWRHDMVTDEMTYGIWSPVAAPAETVTSVLPGAYWRHDMVTDEMTYGIWSRVAAPAAAALAAPVTFLDLGIPDWPPSTLVHVAATAPHGGHMNIMD